MPLSLPSGSLRVATPDDRERVAAALQRGTATVLWPSPDTLRDWSRRRGWPTSRFGYKEAFTGKMLESDESFALALSGSGIQVTLPVERYAVPEDDLRKYDEWYAARSPDNRPTQWGDLVEALREIRRAIEAGVEVEIDGATFDDFGPYYIWLHARYHMLEDGYDKWVGDDN